MIRIYSAIAILASLGGVYSFLQPSNVASKHRSSSLSSTVASEAAVPSSPWFTDSSDGGESKEKLKTQILQLGAALDRGQSYNPTSGDYYSSSMDVARGKVQALISLADAETNVPKSLDDIAGEWEVCWYDNCITNVPVLFSSNV